MEKNILFVYSTMMVGGSTTALLSLLNAFEYDKYNVDLLLYDLNGPLMSSIPSQVNILPPARKYDNRLKRILKMLAGGYLFKAVFHNLKYKKKFGFMPQDMSFAKNSTCRRLNKKYDAAVGGLELWPNAYVNEMVDADVKISWIHTDYAKNKYIPSLEEFSLNKSDYIVCVSDILKERFLDMMPKLKNKVVYLPNMLSTSLVKQMSNAAISDSDLFLGEYFKIITVARAAIYQKRLDRAVNVLSRLKKDGFNVKWYIVGDGPDKEKLEFMAKEAGVSDSFIMLGSRSNPYPYYKQCDLFSLVSECEGRPISITEAQILGLPILATRYESVATQICDYENGLIAENNEDSIYDKLKELLTNRELFDNLKNNSRIQTLNDNRETYDRFIDMCSRKVD